MTDLTDNPGRLAYTWLRVPVESFTVGTISVGRGFGFDAGIVIEMTGPMELSDVEARSLAAALRHAGREFRLERLERPHE